MTPQVKRGLQWAKDRMRIELRDFAASSRHRDLMAAIKWIAHQEKIDRARRSPRGPYVTARR